MWFSVLSTNIYLSVVEVPTLLEVAVPYANVIVNSEYPPTV